ncbi:restriction endonuclease subunit S [Bernardetia sp.]|uniref:restriction endonuclease subunit S n=1 Tax=Bernardetia sp. TaxID=1937974 RepID=UPI0025C70E38|nr:restriction endonuclease subunit S [Bernardetia sp.]
MNNNKNIPKLRFPEFQNDGKWKKRKFHKVGEFIGGGTPSTSNPEYWNGTIQWYTPTEVKNGVLKPSLRTITKLGLKKSSAKLLPIGTILITTRATIGDVAITEKECTTNQGFQSLVVNDTEVNVFWLYWIVKFKNELIKRCSGSTFKEIGKTEIKSIPTLSPPKKEEQKKIASCLLSLDELITAHTEKLALLEEHKKGLMQNLFPKEGEKVPAYRFPQFRNDGEWEEKKLGDVADKEVRWSFTGGPFGSNLKAEDYTKEGIRIIQLQNIGDGEFQDSYKIYTSESKANELISCNIYAGEIILSKMGDPVGRACIIPENLERCVMASDGIRLVVDEEKYSKYFIFSLINSQKIRQAIESKATGSTRKRIGLNELRETELLLPKSEKEQKKIASCLSSLDELITKQSKKIESLQQHKKGLMQGLFPSDN